MTSETTSVVISGLKNLYHAQLLNNWWFEKGEGLFEEYIEADLMSGHLSKAQDRLDVAIEKKEETMTYELDKQALDSIARTTLGGIEDLCIGDKVTNQYEQVFVIEPKGFSQEEGVTATRRDANGRRLAHQSVKFSTQENWKIHERKDGWYFIDELNLKEGDTVLSKAGTIYRIEVVNGEKHFTWTQNGNAYKSRCSLFNDRFWRIQERADTFNRQLSDNLGIKRAEAERLRDDLRVALEQNDKDTAEILRLNDVIEARNQRIQDMSMSNNGLADQNADLEEELADERAMADKYKALCGSLESKVFDLVQEQARDKETIKDLERRNDNQFNSLVALQEQLASKADVSNEVARLKELLEERDNCLAQYRTGTLEGAVQMRELRNQLNGEIAQRKTAEREVEEWKKKYAERKAQVFKLAYSNGGAAYQSLAHSYTELQQECKDHEITIRDLVRQLAKANEEVDNLKEVNDNYALIIENYERRDEFQNFGIVISI